MHPLLCLTMPIWMKRLQAQSCANSATTVKRVCVPTASMFKQVFMTPSLKNWPQHCPR